MRKYGTIEEVDFSNYGYDIYNLAIKYKLSYYGTTTFVYVNTMKELRKEITNLTKREAYE